jgi:hypothetical protein
MVQGRVVDAETQQPIAGAVVVGVWTTITGFIPGLQSQTLAGVREAETDANGRFALKGYRSSGPDRTGNGQAITVYKPGYVAWSNLYTFPTSRMREDQRVPPEIRLERFPAGESHRRHLDFIDGARQSVLYRGNVIPRFYEAIRPEREMAR